uniref:Uncharacterized protein n=1 Tax=Avena sativa TaxID=4498 RepID=A0ACD6A4M2_AVESA
MRALSSEEEMSHPRKHAAMSRRTGRADQQRKPAPALPTTIVSHNPIFFREDDGCTDALAAVGKPLPLPPSRAHLSAGSGPAGPALVMSRHGSGWVLRVPHHDPFLAAYVACTKGGAGGKVDSAPAKGKQQQKKNKRGDAAQGCGIWSGWAAGAMSCKYGCDVAGAVQAEGPAAAQAQESTVPRLHLSRQLVVIPARKRALARGRAHG